MLYKTHPGSSLIWFLVCEETSTQPWQSCWCCGSLAAELEENGERMRKWWGNGERMRKWTENEEIEREWGNEERFTLYISSLSIHFLDQKLSHLVAKFQIGHFCRECHKKHTRYEKIILGRIRCEKAPQVVTNKSLNDKCLHYRTMIWRRFLPFQNPDYNDVKSHLVAIVLQISLRILHCWTILLLLARPNNNLKTNVFFQERRPAL